MSTNFNNMLSTIISAKKYATSEINRLNDYIQEMTEMITLATEGESISCPLCQGQMMNLASILDINPSIKHGGGSMSLSSCLNQSANHVDGWECQSCGVFEVEVPQGKVQLWNKEAPGGVKSLPYLVLHNFEEVIRVYSYRPTYQATFIFEFPNMAVTYGHLSKDEIIDRLKGIKDIFRPSSTKSVLIQGRELVYLMKSKEGYKIGLSGDPEVRLKQIKSHAPSIKLIHDFEADDSRMAEKLLHEEFQGKHIGGEWFDLSDSEVEDIKFIAEFKNGKFTKEQV